MIRQLIVEEGSRLATLSGPDGVGTTRLAGDWQRPMIGEAVSAAANAAAGHHIVAAAL